MNKTTINSIIKGTVSDLDYQGQGVVKNNSLVFFIAGALPNEEIEFRVTKLKKRFGEGTLTKIIKKSSERVLEERSKYGATDLLHLSLAGQEKWQEDQTKTMFSRRLNYHQPLDKMIKGTKVNNYRNKTVFHALPNQETLAFGLYTPSNVLKQIEDFILASEKANEILKIANQLKMKVTRNNLKHLVIRTNENGEALITLTVYHALPELNQLVEILSKTPKVVGITFNYIEDESQILSQKSKTVYGENKIIQMGGKLELVIDDNSFFQINNEVARKTYELISSYVKPTQHLMDCYSGVGTIGLSLASSVSYVTMIDSNSSNTKQARINALKNGVNNLTIINDLVENTNLEGEIIIVDPPRGGLHTRVVEIILKNKPERILYLSCNLSTLVRDLEALLDGYTIKHVHPIRMFPQTTTTETLVVLERNDENGKTPIQASE